MDKSEVRILIVEDDPSMGQAIFELFKRSGYDACLCTTPEQAQTFVEQQEFHALIIDCMLPRMNGVDLAVTLMKKMDPRPALFLMTGIFKDKTFIKEALAKTKAQMLLAKPFQLEKLLGLVEKELKSHFVDPDLEPLPSLLTRAECATQEILIACQEQASFHAYHIPLVLSLFARQGMTGELNIVSTERDISQITFIEGKIVDVRSSNKATQIGELLIEFGFAMPEDVEEVLAQVDPTLPLATRLVQAGALSPHAVGLIREEQLAIRLSQLIQNTSIEISWLKKNVEMKETFHAMPPGRLKLLMSEWILSKLPAEWLRSFYLQYSERTVQWRGKAAVKIEGAKSSMPMLPVLLERLQSQPTVQDLLVEAGENELKSLQAIHTLVLERKIYFGEKRGNADDFQTKINRYQRLLLAFRSRDFFQILGVSQKARAGEVHRSYTDLAKRFHPDKVPPHAPRELKELCNELFAMISHAHDTLADDFLRNRYLEELSRREAHRAMEMEPQYEEAVNDLRAQKYASAAKKFDDLIGLKAPMPDLRAYSYWAKIKSGLKVSEKDFFEIPPENRHSPIYLLAKGLNYKSVGHFQKALECFQNARLMDKHLSEAQREIVELIDEAGTKVTGVNTFLDRLLGKKEVKKKRRSA